MAENMRVTLTFDAKDQGASAATKAVQANVDQLNKSLGQTQQAGAGGARGIDQYARSAQSAMQQLRELDAIEGKRARNLGELAQHQTAYDAALKANLITTEEHAVATGKLSQQGAKLFAAFEKSTPVINSGAAALKGFTLNLAAMQREGGVITGELLRGNFGQLEKSIVTLARQSGVLAQVFTLTGGAIAAGTVVVGGAIAVYEHAANQQNEYNRAIALTGNYAKTTAGELDAQARTIGAATGQYGAATDALTALAASGKVTGDNMVVAAQGAVAFADLTGESIDKAVAEFVKLQEKPYDAAIKLDQQLHVLSVAQADEIRMLEETGRKAEAAALATADFADALLDRDKEYRASLHGIAGLWGDIKTAIEQASGAAGGFLDRTIENVRKAAKNNSPGQNLLQGFLDFAIPGKGAADLASASTRPDFSNVTDQTKEAAAAQKELDGAINQTTHDMAAETAALQKKLALVDGTTRAQVAYEVQQKLLAAGSAEEADRIIAEGDAQFALADKIDAATAAKKKHGNASKDLARVESELDNQWMTSATLAEQLAQGFDGPVQSAFGKLQAQLKTLGSGLDVLDADLALGRITQEQYAAGFELIAAGAAHAGEAFELLKAKDAALQANHQADGTAVDQLTQKWRQEINAISDSATATDALNAKLKAEHDAIAAIDADIRASTSPEQIAELEKRRAAILANADAFAQDAQAAKLNAQAAKEWVGIWTSAADQFSSGIANAAGQAIFHFKSIADVFHSIGQVLENTAQQIVSSIINYFFKLAVINPILNAIFGGSAGFSALPELAGGLLGGGSSAGGATGAGGASYGGLGYDVLGYGATHSGILAPVSGWITGNPGTVGAIGAYGGAALGGYYGYTHAGGGAAGVAAGLAYGTAGYIGGTALAGAAIGGATAGAAGAVAGGVGAGYGALAALGPVGWIALAAVLVDMFSGGKLFGTAGKFKYGEQTLSIGPGGADVSAGYVTKGQKPLFGGSFTKFHSTAPSQDAIDAANQFFDQLQRGTDLFAKQFGAKVGDIVGGSFTQQFDKHGKPTTSSTTIGGHTYTGESFGDFENREIAENELAVLGQFDKNLAASIDKYRANAQDLLAITNDLAQGELMIQKSGGFLALGTDQTVSALLHLAEANQKFGESVDQTLQRLEAAQQQYDAFVGQFKPQATYADAFQASLAGINDQYKQNVKQANDLAIAAGAAGASQEDLANIQKFAAAQMAEAVKQLHAASQSLANDLGFTSQGESADQIQQQIDAIYNNARNAQNGLGGFGQAITQVSQRAIDAMNLMLGDLSPLNDQAKLQQALAGLRAGTATQQQVLEIGRRLYGASNYYTDLYNQVVQIGDHTQHAGGNTGQGGAVHLSAGDQQRVAQLQAQKQDAENAQRHDEAVQLARNIADESAATGKSYEEVAKSLDVTFAQLEKELGLKSDKELIAMFDSFKQQRDSVGQSTADIVASINNAADRIVDAVTGGHSTHGRPGAGDDGRSGGSPSPPTGHSGHGIDGDRVGRDMAHGFIRETRNLSSFGARNNVRAQIGVR